MTGYDPEWERKHWKQRSRELTVQVVVGFGIIFVLLTVLTVWQAVAG